MPNGDPRDGFSILPSHSLDILIIYFSAVAGDNDCTQVRGVCQCKDKECTGQYEDKLCSGDSRRKCCIPKTSNGR